MPDRNTGNQSPEEMLFDRLRKIRDEKNAQDTREIDFPRGLLDLCGTPEEVAQLRQQRMQQQLRQPADREALTRTQLGPYMGNSPGYYRDDPVIFTNEVESPHRHLQMLSAFLTPNGGAAAGWGSGAQDRGKTRMIVRGDPYTGEASSWTMHQWAGSGEKMPNLDTETNNWQRLPTVESAYRFRDFPEHLKAFEKYRSGK